MTHYFFIDQLIGIQDRAWEGPAALVLPLSLTRGVSDLAVFFTVTWYCERLRSVGKQRDHLRHQALGALAQTPAKRRPREPNRTG